MREASGTASNLVSLPSGGGGIAPLGDRFQPDLVRGSGSYSVPIACPKGPNELQPSLSLTYSTGSGNGAFGLGWRLDVPRIERRCDRGIPSYTDDDTFVIGDAEVLVDLGGGRFRPKTDTRFWHVERRGDGWRIRTGDGRTLLFGQTAASRESAGERIFAWYLDEERDAAGNAINYSYRRDGGRLYPSEVRYSVFRVRIEYGPRPDRLRTARSGFERLTALRGVAIELHCSRLSPTLMRTYKLSYEEAENGASLLVGISASARQGTQTARLPELGFEYSRPDFATWDVTELRSLLAVPRLDDRRTQLVDLTGDGLPDVLESHDSSLFLWRNRGDGWLEGPTRVAGVPSTMSLESGNVAFADLDGNGRPDLFVADEPLQLAFESDGRGGFRPDPVVFRERPTLALAEPETRLMDVDGDGVTDLLRTGRSSFLLFRHEPGVGWEEPFAVQRDSNLERFPDLSLADTGVRLADMTGDGLQDFVLVTSGNVCYWPYHGNGAWGGRVELERPPELPPGFRDERLQLVDLDGDGCSDLAYLDHDRILIWLNRCGEGFAPPVEVPVAPGNGSVRPPLAADLLGDGRPGFAWTGSPLEEYGSGYRYLRFGEGRKPYLLTAIDNGMGGRTEMAYGTSTAMRLADQGEGLDWQGELPFPVHVVTGIRERDLVSGRSVDLAIRYHDGVYDGAEREFRGFRRVTVDLEGDDSIPGSRQVVDYLQGDPDEADLAKRERQRALAGALVRTQTLEQVGDGWQVRSESAHGWEARLEHEGPEGRVHFPFLAEIETREHGLPGSPDRIERTTYADYDAHGNVGRRLRASFADGEPESRWITSEEHFTYTANEADWLVKLPVRRELRDGEGVPFAVSVTYYDGAAFVGLGEGQATGGLRTRTQEVQLLGSRLPAGYIGGRNLAALGYELTGSGSTRGYYATTYAVRRDGRGNVVEQRDPLGSPTRFTYDAGGLYPVSATDALGRRTAFVFSPRSGEPERVSSPDGRVVRYAYDPLGRLRATFEAETGSPEQLLKCWLVDLRSAPASIVSVAPREAGRRLPEFRLSTDFEALSGVSVSRVYYDGFGNELVQVARAPDGPGGARRFATRKRARLNPRGLAAEHFLPTFVADLDVVPLPAPGSGSIRTRYDVDGAVTEVAGPGPVHQRVVRDSFAIEHHDGDGAGAFGDAAPPGPVRRTERFDARQRLVQIEEAVGDGTIVVTSYDLALDGRMQAIRDGAGDEVARYAYAGPAEFVRVTHRDAGTRTYYRDAAGRLVERVDADGSRLFYRYDAAGRLLRIERRRAPGAALQVVRELSYDAAGRIAAVGEAGNRLRYAYNRVGQPVREEVTAAGRTLVVRREYDFQGTPSAVVYPDGHRLEYVLDDSGTVRAVPSVVSRVDYDAGGEVVAYRLANGVDVRLPRDPVSHRLTEVSARKGTTILRRLAYGYDAVGNITEILDRMPGSVERHAFAYDGLHRLTGDVVRNASGALLRRSSYGYDKAGNALQFDDVAPVALSYGDALRPGRLTAVSAAGASGAVAYDARANVTSLPGLAAVEYDAFDRVARALAVDGTEVRLAYDPQNRKLLTETRSGGTTSRVQHATGLFEQHATHAVRHVFLGSLLVASQTVGLGGPAAVRKAYYLADHHGTLLLATDQAGTVLAQQRYSPFGAALRPAARLDRYLGRERDPTGLLHLGARHYAPSVGRFLSPDWYVLENPSKPLRLPQGWSVYAYALGNPIVFKDPSGMWFLIDDLIVLGVGFVVGFVTGLIYGLANGRGWDSLLLALETGLTTAVGAWLGWNIAGVAGALSGGMNGLLGGLHQIYDWRSASGWFAFLSDSTWGLIGTTLGNVVHIINFFWSGSNYRQDLSFRQNRHVYEGGFALKGDFAFTQGNVISNAGLGTSTVDASFIANHEELHVWQSRFFGPLFQATYIVWAVAGLFISLGAWALHPDEDYGSLLESAAYYNNPFEYWAYKNDNNWPPSGINPNLIIWG